MVRPVACKLSYQKYKLEPKLTLAQSTQTRATSQADGWATLPWQPADQEFHQEQTISTRALKMAPKDGLGRGSEQRAAAAAPGVHLEKLLSDSLPLTQTSSLCLKEKKRTCPGFQLPRASPCSALLTCRLLSLWFGIPRQRHTSY